MLTLAGLVLIASIAAFNQGRYQKEIIKGQAVYVKVPKDIMKQRRALRKQLREEYRQYMRERTNQEAVYTQTWID